MTTYVSILRIPGFPSAGLPEGLTPEWLGEALAPACAVRYISLAALKAGLIPGKSDLGHGGIWPATAWSAGIWGATPFCTRRIT